VKIQDFLLVDANGISLDILTSGMPIRFIIDYDIQPSIPIEEIGFTILIKTLNGEVIANLNSQKDMGLQNITKRMGQVCCSINHFPIAPGTITMALIVERKAEVLEMIEDVFVGEVDRGGHLREKVIGDRKGWVEIEHEWKML
jgi:hypothetical protein